MSTLAPGATPERRLLAKLSDARELIRYMTEQRDAARRIACGSEDAETLQEQARRANLRGWGYLYPEPVAVAADEHPEFDPEAWLEVRAEPLAAVTMSTPVGPHFVVMCDACGEPIAAAEVETDFVDCGDITEVARVHARCRGIL